MTKGYKEKIIYKYIIKEKETMKLIDSSYEIIEPKSYDLGSVFKHIELCGRVCYKSEDKITPDSATKFVDRMIKSGHTSVLEHGTIYLEIPWAENWEKYKYNPYSRCNSSPLGDEFSIIAVTTNYRVLIENNWLDDLKYVCEPTEYHERRYTVRFVCDRGVSHEFVRHRHFSFSQESTRYCNYSKDKFGNELTFIKPIWYDSLGVTHRQDFEIALERCEDDYLEFIRQGWTPQQARAVLPNALKTELIMTGFASDWEHFFDLRDDKRAHPDAYKLAHDLHNEFIKRNYVYGETNSEE